MSLAIGSISYLTECFLYYLQALMALFVLASKDGWVSIMYTGLDAVGVDQQVMEYYMFKFLLRFENNLPVLSQLFLNLIMTFAAIVVFLLHLIKISS